MLERSPRMVAIDCQGVRQDVVHVLVSTYCQELLQAAALGASVSHTVISGLLIVFGVDFHFTRSRLFLYLIVFSRSRNTLAHN